LVDMLPDSKTTDWTTVRHFTPVPGGAPANVCIGVSKLGLQAAFIGEVGQDPFGRLLYDTLRRCEVDVSGLRFHEKVRTTLAFVCVRPHGENEYIFYRNPGADMMLRPEEISSEQIAEASIFHFGSISMSHEPSYGATLHAVNLAHRHGLFISFDPNLRPFLWDSLERARSRMEEGLKVAHLVKLNEEELEFLTGTNDLERGSRHLLEQGPEVVVVTRGAQGSFVHTGSHHLSVPAFSVPVVDTVGCGDAFTAALLLHVYGRGSRPAALSSLSRPELEQVLRFAAAAGALTAGRNGVIPSLPRQSEIKKFLQDAATEPPAQS